MGVWVCSSWMGWVGYAYDNLLVACFLIHEGTVCSCTFSYSVVMQVVVRNLKYAVLLRTKFTASKVMFFSFGTILVVVGALLRACHNCPGSWILQAFIQRNPRCAMQKVIVCAQDTKAVMV